MILNDNYWFKVLKPTKRIVLLIMSTVSFIVFPLAVFSDNKAQLFLRLNSRSLVDVSKTRTSGKVAFY